MTRRFGTTIGTADLTLNCRTRVGRTTVGRVMLTDGTPIVAPHDDPAGGPVDAHLVAILCPGAPVELPGSRSIPAFLDRLWPPVKDMARGW